MLAGVALGYNIPLFKVVYYDLELQQTVVKNKVFSFTVDNLLIKLKKKQINQLTIIML